MPVMGIIESNVMVWCFLGLELICLWYANDNGGNRNDVMMIMVNTIVVDT